MCLCPHLLIQHRDWMLTQQGNKTVINFIHTSLQSFYKNKIKNIFIYEFLTIQLFLLKKEILAINP